MIQAHIAIEWKAAPPDAAIEIERGSIRRGDIARGKGQFRDGRFSGSAGEPVRLELLIDADGSAFGADPTVVRIHGCEHPFAFMTRDVFALAPILIPAYGVAVTTVNDTRSYSEIRDAIAAKGLLSNLQRIEMEPEESFDEAAKNTRELHCPIWMGISRDVRIFEFGLRHAMHVTDYIQPRFHGNDYYRYHGTDSDYLAGERYGFVAGRGWGAAADTTWQHLDQGALPILHLARNDGDVRYEMTTYVTLERNPLKAENVKGTHYLVADGLCHEYAFTEEQKKRYQEMRVGELSRDEETVIRCRIVAINTAKVPRYVWFKAVHPLLGAGYMNQPAYIQDPLTGFGKKKDTGLVFGISKLDDQPIPQSEIAVLVQPGKSCVMEFTVPHRPVSEERARALASRSFDAGLEECRAFWKSKLNAAGSIEVPEPRITEMVKAGLLQLDLATYGNEPDKALLMSSGIYSAQAGEVWENAVFYDSLGLHDLARRALQFFLEKQQENGFIQNFSGYMLETGCVLLAFAEHFRYTRDDAFAASVARQVVKACQYVLDGLARNRREELRGKGYGLIEGRVADPVDEERIFMLNAFAYSGLLGAADLLQKTDTKFAQRVREQANQLKGDLRTAFFDALAGGPVIPLADGTWAPTVAPWAGPSGPKCLFLDGKQWWTHGSMTVRDDILGPIHLLSNEVIDPKEQAATFLLNYSNELMFSRNVASSQPYFVQHPFVHLRRDEVKPFLKAYYNAFAAQCDRQIYTWWEHFFHVSPHKTHETAGFLMQTRHMLWMEEGQTLKLLRGIPRAWLKHGKRIELRNVASHFGHFSLTAVSDIELGRIEAQVTFDPKRQPSQVQIRLPHPLGQRPTSVQGGRYDPAREAVTLDSFSGKAHVSLSFAV